ncbi:PH domain-containing protein [Paenibacillus methanolicus]|uniref:PH (Pleckstrin Homology) domain-containing protein n=1 Tax=Paenibacillus methanolicus TaxID=582686 RepID=A0A5S5C4L2_9BACL|nr:PH domain-containing protein [Paenibacillus methanolicus]TYP74079.1 PH (Pleckstrin Homology) domain-containing protein [Paenibacillus methanolicus]
MNGSNERAAGAGRRLHPVSMLYFIGKGMKELYGWLPLIPVLALSAPKVFGPGANRLAVASVLAGIAVLALLAMAWVRWRKFVYRIDANGVYVEHGLWIQNRLWITKESVQSLDVKTAVYDRQFRLVTLHERREEKAMSGANVIQDRGLTASQADLEGGNGGIENSSTAIARNLGRRELLLHSTTSDKFG